MDLALLSDIFPTGLPRRGDRGRRTGVAGVHRGRGAGGAGVCDGLRSCSVRRK